MRERWRKQMVENELNCPACQENNPAGAEFCQECGAKLGATASGATAAQAGSAAKRLSIPRRKLVILGAVILLATMLGVGGYLAFARGDGDSDDDQIAAAVTSTSTQKQTTSTSRTTKTSTNSTTGTSTVAQRDPDDPSIIPPVNGRPMLVEFYRDT
jgi:uncharacterized membrane protein YvbJ